MLCYLTLSETPLPNVTSPDTVKWSNSMISGILANLQMRIEIKMMSLSQTPDHIVNTNLDKNSFTLLKWLSPNLINGVVGNILCGDITSEPPRRLYKLDMTSSKSDVFLTGKKRDRGTLIPMAPSKHFMAAPTAVSN